jgi:hypothetical protein
VPYNRGNIFGRKEARRDGSLKASWARARVQHHLTHLFDTAPVEHDPEALLDMSFEREAGVRRPRRAPVPVPASPAAESSFVGGELPPAPLPPHTAAARSSESTVSTSLHVDAPRLAEPAVTGGGGLVPRSASVWPRRFDANPSSRPSSSSRSSIFEGFGAWSAEETMAAATALRLQHEALMSFAAASTELDVDDSMFLLPPAPAPPLPESPPPADHVATSNDPGYSVTPLRAMRARTSTGGFGSAAKKNPRVMSVYGFEEADEADANEA